MIKKGGATLIEKKRRKWATLTNITFDDELHWTTAARIPLCLFEYKDWKSEMSFIDTPFNEAQRHHSAQSTEPSVVFRSTKKRSMTVRKVSRSFEMSEKEDSGNIIPITTKSHAYIFQCDIYQATVICGLGLITFPINRRNHPFTPTHDLICGLR